MSGVTSEWAAAAPGAGFSETAEFLKVYQKEPIKPTWYEEKLWHWYDCTDYALNLFNCPTVAYSGEIDTQKQAADKMGVTDRWVRNLLIANSPGRLLGETGVLRVQGSGVIGREPVWAIVRDGTLVAMPSVALATRKCSAEAATSPALICLPPGPNVKCPLI